MSRELPILIIKLHPTRDPTLRLKRETTPVSPVCSPNIDRRSLRSARKSVCYKEKSVSPVKTPRRITRKNNDNIENDDDDFIPQTPKSVRTPIGTPRTRRVLNGTPKGRASVCRTPQKDVSTPRTPKSVSRRINMGQLTPSLRVRAQSIENCSESPSSIKHLPGREKEMDTILSFVRSNLTNESSGCMYISGVPGTGKTATVNAALQILRKEKGLPDFQLIEINGMAVAEPRQAFVQIYKQLTGKIVTWEQAHSLLDKRFTSHATRRNPTVMLVDELDALCTRRLEVIYGLLEWTSGKDSRLTVLTVANSLDLPERALNGRVGSRAGVARLAFSAYTHGQLQTIVAARLGSASNLTADALQLVARKVAAASGDARRALALCSRALELGGDKGAGLAEVSRALDEASASDSVNTIKRCCGAEQLVLKAMAAEVERTGSSETTLSRILSMAADIMALEGRPYKAATRICPLSHAQAKAICARLASSNLIHIQHKAFNPKVSLVVNRDDIHYATRPCY